MRKPLDEQRRIDRCKAYLREKAPYFRSIVFSDEKYFDVNDNSSKFCFVKKGQQAPWRPKDTSATKLHVWGCVGVNFKLPVVL